MIYRPINLLPENTSIDATATSNFSCIIDGDICDAYQLRVYDGNTLIYDSTKITLSPVLYDGETLNIPVSANTFTQNKTLTYTIECFEGSSNNAISQFVQFYTNTPPNVSLSFPSPIASQNIQLQANYSQTESLPMAEYTYIVKNNNNGEELYNFTKVGSQDTRYTLEGLPNNISGTIEFKGITTRGFIFTTGELNFTTSYSSPNINITPTTTLNKTNSFVSFDWGVFTQINGSVSGGYNYYSNYIYLDNTALNLDAGSILTYNLNFGYDFTLKYKFDLLTDIDKKICQLSSGSTTYAFHWDGINNRFYWDNNGVVVNSVDITVPVVKAYVVILPQLIYVKLGNNIIKITNIE